MPRRSDASICPTRRVRRLGKAAGSAPGDRGADRRQRFFRPRAALDGRRRPPRAAGVAARERGEAGVRQLVAFTLAPAIAVRARSMPRARVCDR
jgi:hypothetical protein